MKIKITFIVLIFTAVVVDKIRMKVKIVISKFNFALQKFNSRKILNLIKRK
jgi:hypothetical protein